MTAFTILCTHADGGTVLATVTPDRSTRLSDGRTRHEAARPGGGTVHFTEGEPGVWPASDRIPLDVDVPAVGSLVVVGGRLAVIARVSVYPEDVSPVLVSLRGHRPDPSGTGDLSGVFRLGQFRPALLADLAATPGSTLDHLTCWCGARVVEEQPGDVYALDL